MRLPLLQTQTQPSASDFHFHYPWNVTRQPKDATRKEKRPAKGDDGEWKVFFREENYVPLLLRSFSFFFFSRSSLISPVFFISRRRHRRRLGRCRPSGGNDDVVDESGNGVCFSCCFRLLGRRMVFCLWKCGGFIFFYFLEEEFRTLKCSNFFQMSEKNHFHYPVFQQFCFLSAISTWNFLLCSEDSRTWHSFFSTTFFQFIHCTFS